ncbi:MAG TPA: hypothetical protein DCP63_03475 [Bacteroidetes bacterium]|nr:hypothetical protein [Bacteroidota bacterium]
MHSKLDARNPPLNDVIDLMVDEMFEIFQLNVKKSHRKARCLTPKVEVLPYVGFSAKTCYIVAVQNPQIS